MQGCAQAPPRPGRMGPRSTCVVGWWRQDARAGGARERSSLMGPGSPTACDRRPGDPPWPAQPGLTKHSSRMCGSRKHPAFYAAGLAVPTALGPCYGLTRNGWFGHALAACPQMACRQMAGLGMLWPAPHSCCGLPHCGPRGR